MGRGTSSHARQRQRLVDHQRGRHDHRQPPEAQAFTEPRYFWPRPSAVDYNGAGAGGSNKSPTSTDVADRGRELAERYGATLDNPLPADLAAASGGGLDPHISEKGALYQVARVAEARGLDVARVETLVRNSAFSPGGFLTQDRIVNVLELNLALDAMTQTSQDITGQTPQG